MKRQHKFKVGDSVKCIAGGSTKAVLKGKIGKIKALVGVDRVIVDGLNFRKKNIKRKSFDQKSKVEIVEMPLHCSNLMYYSASLGKSVKIVKKEIDGEFKRGYLSTETGAFVECGE